ncbi:MAG TPA: YbhB/YbcL family Raf kinase inhibitor-like protein, partial [Synergistaceae bacterium]|nr:YbhB/YbcL family Raf kinase inhibitor-like protein [Synergistaceae bacterium]
MMPKETGYRNGNVSPALFWEDVPEGVKSFVLVMDDPDAQGWTHWVVYNIPP